MKGFLYYIWKNRLLPDSGLHTADGTKLEIISYGQPGERDNIFENVKIRVGDKEQCGNVVLLQKSAADERATNGKAILHIKAKENSDEPVCSTHVTCDVPGLFLTLPHGLESEYSKAEQQQQCLQCENIIGCISKIEMSSFLSRLAVERIEEKANGIMHTFSLCNNFWDDTLFKTIARSFGFGIQSNVFEKWARNLDMNALGKHRDNLLQIEAIMFGQAGLLCEESIPHYYLKEAQGSTYYKEISREYRFLKNKFGLQEIDHKEWNCGNASPHVRIARLAALYSTRRIGISAIMACDTASEYCNIIDTTPTGYWHNHTCLGGTETTGNGGMKQRQLDVIIINAVVPTLYIYGKHRNNSAICSKAEDLLYHIKAEENSIVKKWKEKGVTVECAADSQAVIQLEKMYCRTCNCTKCRIAYHYIKDCLR